MSEWIGYTNQRIYQAYLVCQEAGGLHENATLQQAMLESCAHMTFIAYRSYLNELAEKYKCRMRIANLTELMTAVPLKTSEISELANLESQPDSWLSTLLFISRATGWPNSTQNTVESHQDSLPHNIIATDGSSFEKEELSAKQLKGVLRHLENLIEHQRSFNVEN